jgi:hypothetical protein
VKQSDLDALNTKIKQLTASSSGKDQVSSLALQALEEKLIGELEERQALSESNLKQEFTTNV